MTERNFLQRLQEYIDCFMETDPQNEMQKISKEGVAGDVTGDVTEVALKYLSLALISSVEERAGEIIIVRKNGKGECKLKGDMFTQLLNAPDEIVGRALEILHEITGIEQTGKTGLIACGFRNDQLELKTTFQKKPGEETVVLRLPPL